MRFERTWALWLIPGVALLLLWLSALVQRKRWGSASAWSPELGAESRRLGRYTPVKFALVGLAAGLAFAGPRWGMQPHQAESRALDLVVLMDISRSMLAQDAAPDRLQAATGFARRLVQDLVGDRVGLVVFAARGYLMVPLTLDRSAVLVQLDALDPGIASEGGSGIVSGLELSRMLLTARSNGGDRAIVLFTDGESFDGEATLKQAGQELRKAGITLVAVPIGTAAGALIPDPTTRWYLDASGEEVVTQRRDDLLRQIVEPAGGVMIAADAPDPPSEVYNALAGLTRASVSDRIAAELVPRGWWFALLASGILFLAAWFRRSSSLIAILLLLGTSAASAQRPALGVRMLQRGDTAAARFAFEEDARLRGGDTAWYNLGTLALAAGDYPTATQALERATGSLDPRLRQRALYNLGTARLAQARHSPETADSLLSPALNELRQALILDPRDSSAKFNYELAHRLLPPPPPTSSQPQPQTRSEPPQSGDESKPQGGSGMSRSEADQVLNAMERIEKSTRQMLNSRQAQNRSVGRPDW